MHFRSVNSQQPKRDSEECGMLVLVQTNYVGEQNTEVNTEEKID